MEKPKLDNLSGISLALGILSVGTAVLYGFGLPGLVVGIIALIGIVISIIALVKNQKHGALALCLCILGIIIFAFTFEYEKQKAIEKIQELATKANEQTMKALEEMNY